MNSQVMNRPENYSLIYVKRSLVPALSTSFSQTFQSQQIAPQKKNVVTKQGCNAKKYSIIKL